eukprot:366562-Chlamydomonas_euryale.AAC.13
MSTGLWTMRPSMTLLGLTPSTATAAQVQEIAVGGDGEQNVVKREAATKKWVLAEQEGIGGTSPCGECMYCAFQHRRSMHIGEPACSASPLSFSDMHSHNAVTCSVASHGRSWAE